MTEAPLRPFGGDRLEREADGAFTLSCANAKGWKARQEISRSRPAGSVPGYLAYGIWRALGPVLRRRS